MILLYIWTVFFCNVTNYMINRPLIVQHSGLLYNLLAGTVIDFMHPFYSKIYGCDDILMLRGKYIYSSFLVLLLFYF